MFISPGSTNGFGRNGIIAFFCFSQGTTCGSTSFSLAVDEIGWRCCVARRCAFAANESIDLLSLLLNDVVVLSPPSSSVEPLTRSNRRVKWRSRNMDRLDTGDGGTGLLSSSFSVFDLHSPLTGLALITCSLSSVSLSLALKLCPFSFHLPPFEFKLFR